MASGPVQMLAAQHLNPTVGFRKKLAEGMLSVPKIKTGFLYSSFGSFFL